MHFSVYDNDRISVEGSFPTLKREQVYLNNAGGTHFVGQVSQRVSDYLENTRGKESTAIYNEGYATAARYINASRNEIVLGPSTTQLFRSVSYALKAFLPGDEIIVSAMDHEANIAPWVDLATRQSLIIKWWHPRTYNAADYMTPVCSRECPYLVAQDLKSLLSPKTRLVTCTHVSNILGTIHSIKDISSAIRSHNPDILLAVDGVAYASHRLIDVKDLGVDFYSFSWNKAYGPGISLLYASPLALSKLESSGQHLNGSISLQEKLGLAESSPELVAGIKGVTEYLDGRWTAIWNQEAELVRRLVSWLDWKGKRGKLIKIWGGTCTSTEVRVPIVSFTVEGWSSKEFVQAVEQESGGRFRLSWGSFNSVRLVTDTLGLDARDGVVRVSLVHYNSIRDVKELCHVRLRGY